MGFPYSRANFSSSVGSIRRSPVSTLETKDCGRDEGLRPVLFLGDLLLGHTRCLPGFLQALAHPPRGVE